MLPIRANFLRDEGGSDEIRKAFVFSFIAAALIPSLLPS
jgi:hypothetical protein